MRLAAAERGLQPDNRIAARARKPLQAAHQHPLQSFGEECDAEEVLGSPVVFGRMTGIDREQVGRELCLLEAIGEHVRVWQRHFDPGSQSLARSSAGQQRQAKDRA